MAHKVIITDGTKTETIIEAKGINPFNDDRPGVWSPDPADQSRQLRSNKLVPAVYAAITTRMQAMADMPFTIYTTKGDKEIDNSDNYTNALGFLPDPYAFLSKAEGALVCAGRSYWYKGKGERTGKTKQLQYWMPSSVKLDTDKLQKRELIFERNGQKYPEADVLYTWLLDADVELGPPTLWPLESALLAAQANGAINNWVAEYMRRGAIKAMLLMVDGMPPAGEVERIEGWFNRFLSGVRGLQWKVFNSAGVKPTIIGDGLEALRDLSINQDLRYEIHTAMGTRHLLEDENYATADARDRQFYLQTIVPDARLIQASLNNQILHDMGAHLEFEPERLEAFQEDEGTQAQAFLDLFSGFREVMSTEAAFQLASEKLDYQFTDEQKALIQKGIKEKQDSKPQESEKPVTVQSDPSVPPQVTRALQELHKWEKKVQGEGKMVTWYAVNIPARIAKAVNDGSMTFEDAHDAIVGNEPKQDGNEIKALADAINKAAERVEVAPVPPPRHQAAGR